MSDNHYQAIVLGAGPGGYPCAIRLGQMGIKTLVIEKDNWGGVCLNVGCIPSKALIQAGKQIDEINHNAATMGIVVEGAARIDMPKLITWKDEVVAKLTGGIATLLKGNGVDLVKGYGRLAGEGKVEVTGEDGAVTTYTADHIVLATGSRPIQIPGFAFADTPVLDSTKALAQTEVPEHLVVIGGGVIGLEMGMMYNKLGAKVTVIEMQDQVLPGFEKDVVKLVARSLKKAGITVHLKTKASGWEQTDNGIVVHIEGPKGAADIEATKVLVSVGRFPNSEDIGLEAAGVEKNGRYVKVDKQLKTNVPGVYAIGDLVGQPMLAHKATHEGEVVAEVIAGHNVQYDARTVPSVVFTDPEVAVAGMSEPEAQAQGIDVLVGKVPYAAIGRALTTGHTDGFFKVVAHAETKEILGMTIVGSHASDLISEAVLAVEMQAEALDLGLSIHPHPTLGEGVMEAAKAALGEAVHIINRK